MFKNDLLDCHKGEGEKKVLNVWMWICVCLRVRICFKFNHIRYDDVLETFSKLVHSSNACGMLLGKCSFKNWIIFSIDFLCNKTFRYRPKFFIQMGWDGMGWVSPFNPHQWTLIFSDSNDRHILRQSLMKTSKAESRSCGTKHPFVFMTIKFKKKNSWKHEINFFFFLISLYN